MNDLPAYEQELLSLSGIYEEICLDFADKKQVLEFMLEKKKTVLAKLKLKSSGKSEAARETDAYASKEYEDYLNELGEIRKEFQQSQAIKEANKNKIDALITLISLHKHLTQLR